MRSRNLVATVVTCAAVFVSSAQAQSVFRMSPASVQRIVQKHEPSLTLTLPMPSGVDEHLVLERTSVVDATSRLTVMTDNGPVHSPLALTVKTYRARLANGGFAVLTFDKSGTISGMIENVDGRFSISRKRGDVNSGEYVIHRDVVRPFSCGTSESMSSDLQRLIAGAQEKSKSESIQANDTVDMRLAVEGDYMLLQNYNSVDEAAAYVTELVALLSTIYESELNIRFVLGNVRIWETPDDPYPDDISVFDGLLERFIVEYQTKMKSVDRDLAMFLTFRGGQGGIAGSIGGICTEDGSYCAGDVVNNIYGGLATYSSDLFMMAHEIGHVCGGVHTQSCLWPYGPLDSCVASQEGTCVSWGMTRPTRGTLMSYCHQQLESGGTLVYEFHPMSRYMINAFVHSAPCLFNSPLPNSNELHGVVTNAETGEPLPGLKLVLGRYTDPVVTGIPTVDGDTVTTTAADGSYSFSGLGSGIYYIDSDGEWVPKLVGFGGLVLPNVVIVAEPSTLFNLKLTHGHRIEIVVNTKNAGVLHTFNVYSEDIPGLLSTAVSPYDIIRKTDTTFSFIGYLPDGKYIIVPSADSTTYVPNKFSFTLEGPSAPQLPIVTATRSIGEPISSISLGFADQPWSPTDEPQRFYGGVPYRVINTNSSSVVAAGIIPDDGVIVVDSLPTSGQYNFEIEMDTANKAPFSGGTFVAPQWGMFATAYVQQDRRFPLIARAYTMSVTQSTYTPLTEPRVLLDSRNILDSPKRSALPFPLLILDHYFADYYVSTYGYITFGDIAPDPYTNNAFGFAIQSPFTINVFGADLYGFDHLAPDWHVATQLRGVEPNRTYVFEWKKVNIFTVDDQFNPIFIGPVSFQLLIHENGNIDMVYDRPGDLPQETQLLIGLRGNDIYDNNIVTSAGGMSQAVARYSPNGTPFVTLRSADDITSGLTYHWELNTTSVEGDEEISAITIVPNVAHSTVVVRNASTDCTAHVVDVLGVVVQSVTLSNGITAIDVSSLAAGRYMLVVPKTTQSQTVSFIVCR